MMSIQEMKQTKLRIEEALKSPDLDPVQFEKCACELLDNYLPSDMRVVHISGGSSGRDNGFDGEVRRHNGDDPAPVMVTTSREPLNNLKKNLESVKGTVNESEEVYFAYRQELTALGVEKLREAAKEAGRTLYHYDLHWFAEQLLLPENQEICKQLLGFYSFPSSLTRTTDSEAKMPGLQAEFHGREDDLAWLDEQLQAKKDCLVLGQPGIGKTRLLCEFFEKNKKAWFLNSNPDVHEIADYLKNSNSIIVVDDAHKRIDDLQNLIRIRHERECQFRIVAISSPLFKNKVIDALGLGTLAKELTILDGKTIVAIVKSIKYKEEKIRWATGFIGIIRQQAGGKPGLAVTLAGACLKEQSDEQSQGEVIKDILTGEKLRQYLGGKFDKHDSQNQTESVLAAFALGGRSGVSQQAVMTFLGLTRLDLATTVDFLGQYAVLENHKDQDKQFFSVVVPGQLRGALAAQHFFGRHLVLDYRNLEVRNQSEMVRTMIEARSCGALVPDLENLVKDSTVVDSQLLACYASLGEREAVHALQIQPDSLSVLASALDTADALVLPKLLEKLKRTLGESARYGALYATTEDQGLQDILHRWVVAGRSNGLSLKRHQKLVKAMQTQFAIAEENFPEISTQSLGTARVFALMLRLTYTIMEDGETPATKTMLKGRLAGSVLRSCAELWEPFLQILEKLHEALHKIPSADKIRTDKAWRTLWGIVQQAVGHWAFDITKQGLPDEDIDFMQETLSLVLPRILRMAKDEPGYARYFIEIAGREDIKLAPDLLPCNPEFDLIFPPDTQGTTSEEIISERARQREAVEQLATNKAKAMTVGELAAWLDDLFDKASGIRGGRDHVSYLCEVLARQFSSPCDLVSQLFRLKSNSELAIRLLGFVAQDTQDEAVILALIDRCLAQDKLRPYTLSVLIGAEGISDAAFQHILPFLDEVPEALQNACERSLFESFPEHLHQLFTHPKPAAALHAAIGHWQSVHYATTEPNPDVRYPDEWKKAVLGSLNLDLDATGECTTGDPSYQLTEIFAAEQDLAMQWMKAALQSKRYLGYDTREIFKEALPHLGTPQRLTLLSHIQWDENSHVYGMAEIFRYLVNQDVEVYRELLGRDDLKEFHLEPLGLAQAQKISSAWRQLAGAAIAQGKTPGEIFGATLYGTRGTWGEESEVLTIYLEQFSALKGDTELEQVYQAAKKYLEPKIKEAKQREIAWSNG